MLEIVEGSVLNPICLARTFRVLILTGSIVKQFIVDIEVIFFFNIGFILKYVSLYILINKILKIYFFSSTEANS